MILLLRLLAFILMVSGLQGCSSLARTPVTAVDFQAAVAAEDFRTAASVLERLSLDPGADDLSALREDLSLAVERRKLEVLAEAEQLATQQQWHEALQMLQQWRLKLPESEQLVNMAGQIEASRDEFIDEQRLQLIHHRAAQLPDQLALLEKIRLADPGRLLSSWQLHSARQQGFKLVAELLDCAERSIRIGAIERAEFCLEVVLPIANSRQIEQIAAAQRIIAASKRQAEKRRPAPVVKVEPRPSKVTDQVQSSDSAAAIAAADDQRRQMLADYEDAVAAGWWLSAREKLGELEAAWPQDPQVKRRRAELKRLIAEQVSSEIQRGQYLYSRGEIEQALQVWRKAKPLDPKNTVLLAHIARAKKFLAKLDELEK
ncbi:MAG: hypothetical protein GYB33_16910 [Gammaproteobacteria bacterium]|nr:hypothetical protein [Gammaproteobacteria bacterium]